MQVLRTSAKQDREAREAAEAEAKQARLATRLAQERHAAELAEAKRAAEHELQEVGKAASCAFYIFNAIIGLYHVLISYASLGDDSRLPLHFLCDGQDSVSPQTVHQFERA